MDPSPKPGWHSRGYLPHFDAATVIQHITFHLADSLPRHALKEMERALEALPDEAAQRQRRQRYQRLLDAGHGSCVLGQEWAAQFVQEALLHFDGIRYRLLAWTIMPNHVHVLVEAHAERPIARIVQSWKSWSGRLINQRIAAQPGTPLWQRDYWDRWIRDEGHFRIARDYIERNPVLAGLVGEAMEWRFGSAAR